MGLHKEDFVEKRALNKKWSWANTLMIVGLLGFLPAMACGATPANSKEKKEGPLNPINYDPRVSLSPLVEKVSDAVVNIRTTAKVQRGRNLHGSSDLFEFFFGPGNRGRRGHNRPEERVQQSLGSGFLVDASGLVVTNNHVIQGSDEVEVQLSDDRTFKAEIVGTDERTDLALLRIPNAKNLPYVNLGDSDKLKVGDHVVAIGNPFGLDHTVTSGIVSAKERAIGTGGGYDDFIQTDASINPGNSGGPLFDLKGKVVGINTAINPQGQGIGFAIPSNLARDIVDSLSSTGKVVRGWLGVLFQEADEKLAAAFKLKSKGGAVVSNVTAGSPAEKRGHFGW